ncbi:MAG: GNAT family N-acetyltransferase [Flavobacteriales bacterium]|nr:GNAT family N-acetyltransferase [Flavobacteriales bacterium]
MLQDVYYKKEYVELYLNDGEEVFEFDYQKGEKQFYNIAIKRPITQIGKIKITEGYYDVETAYGYGGAFVNTSDESFISEAIDAYQVYCKKNKVIAEFSRIHPLNEQPFALQEQYTKYWLDRNTIAVDTTIDKEERWVQYASKLRTILRKCQKELTFEKSNNIEGFLELYYKTMDKNNAGEYYYFKKDYFEALLQLKEVELFEVKYGGKTISSGFFMFSGIFGHYHLSANDYAYRNLNANYFLLDSVFDIARAKGVVLFHLGGGRTTAKDDKLFWFKNKFSPLVKNFYIGGKVFMPEKYEQYIKTWEKQFETTIPYFLKYRLDS